MTNSVLSVFVFLPALRGVIRLSCTHAQNNLSNGELWRYTSGMSKIVHCTVLKRPAEALDRPPWPGALGDRLARHVSREGWQRWLEHQTRLINEKHLSLLDPEHRRYLEAQMIAFCFGGEVDPVTGYVPPDPD